MTQVRQCVPDSVPLAKNSYRPKSLVERPRHRHLHLQRFVPTAFKNHFRLRVEIFAGRSDLYSFLTVRTHSFHAQNRVSGNNPPSSIHSIHNLASLKDPYLFGSENLALTFDLEGPGVFAASLLFHVLDYGPAFALPNY